MIYYFIPFPLLDHCHGTRVSTTDLKARKKLILASILCLVFMVGEVVGMSYKISSCTHVSNQFTSQFSFQEEFLQTAWQ